MLKLYICTIELSVEHILILTLNLYLFEECLLLIRGGGHCFFQSFNPLHELIVLTIRNIASRPTLRGVICRPIECRN